MGLRLAGDPDWGYRLSRASLVSVLALERVEGEERNARNGPQRGRPAVAASKPVSLLSLPQVQCASPEAARFWGLV